MSKLTRTLILGATLAAMNLAAMTAVAQAQANDQPARRPPTQGQVGESWHQRQLPAEQPNIASDALRRPPTESQVGDSRRHQTDGPAQPVEPGGLPSWLMASLGCWSPSWRWRVGWPCWLPGGPGVGLGSGTRPDHGHRPATLDGAAAPTRQPHHPPVRPTSAAANRPRSNRDHATDHTPAAASTSKGSSSASGALRYRTGLGAPQPRDREIAARNRQIGHLLDQWLTKRQQASRPSAPTKGEAMKVHRRRTLMAIVAVGALIGAALIVVPALATPPSGVTTTPIATGRFDAIDTRSRPVPGKPSSRQREHPTSMYYRTRSHRAGPSAGTATPAPAW